MRRRALSILTILLILASSLFAATAYTSNGTGGGLFNAASTWTAGSGYPSANGDSYTIVAGDTVTVNLDNSAVILGVSTVNGLLTFSTTANTGLNHSALVTITNGGEIRMGASGAAIGASYTAQLVFSPAADNTEMLQINAGGKLTTCGTATHNLASEAWASCYTTLTAQANSGQKNATITSAAMAAKAVSSQKFLISGTTSYTQDEIMVVSSVAGSVITFVDNFVYTHASGAYAVPLNRNVIIKSNAPATRGWIDNDNTAAGNVSLKLTELRDLYSMDGGLSASISNQTFAYCSMNGLTYYGIRGTSICSQSVLCSSGTNYLMHTPGMSSLTECILSGTVFGLYLSTSAQLTDCLFLGVRRPLAYVYGWARMTRCESAAVGAILYAGTARASLMDCDFSAAGSVTEAAGTEVMARNCKIPASPFASTSANCRIKIQSQDHNQVIGAAKTFIEGIGTIERQNSVARSGYAAELTPDTECSSTEPLEVEWDIPCTHGDVLTVSVWVRVNATYGTTHDPTLVLDPGSIYGCNNTSAQDVTTADTWTPISATGTVDLGGAGNHGTVNAVLRVPYYASGGKVYVDDGALRVRGHKRFIADFDTWCNGMPAFTGVLGGGFIFGN